MKENNHLDIFSPFTWKSLYTYLILLVPFLNIFKKKIVSTSANSAKNPRPLNFLKQKTHPVSPHVVLWFLNTSFRCFGRQVLIGCGYGPLTIGAFNLVWTSPATSRGSECPVGRRPRCKKHSFAESVGYGKDENWRKRLQRSRISEFRWVKLWYFTILLLT